MSSANRVIILFVAALVAMPAYAEEVPIVENHYDLKKALDKDKKKGPVVPLEVKLTKGVIDRVAECYKLEQGAPMSEPDRKLLDSWADDVVHQLEPALRFSSCQVDKPTTARCLQDLTTMDCAILAEPIVAAGWDRHLTPQDRKRVEDYATQLAAREANCQGRDRDEAAIVGGIRKDRLAVLIEAQIVMGQCRLMPDRQSACEAFLRSASCEDVLEVSNRGKAQALCPEYLVCSETPKVEDKDPE